MRTKAVDGIILVKRGGESVLSVERGGEWKLGQVGKESVTEYGEL